MRLGEEAGPAPNTVMSALVSSCREPRLACLRGFPSRGVLRRPWGTVAYGFFLSFSVCCFTAAFGSDGVLLALAVFGLRCAVTLPCYLLLAAPAWGTSAALASLSFGRGRRSAPVAYGRSWWLRLGVTSAVLFAGMCADMILSPWLLQLALERILP